MKKRTKIILLIIIVVMWMITIYKLSSMTANNSNGKSTNIISIFIEDTLDITNKYGITRSYPDELKLEHASELINSPLRKVVHASVYFMLALFMIILVSIIFENKRYLVKIIITALICLIFAAGDEFHQTFVDGRTGRLLDVAIDFAGSIAGIIFYSTYYICYKIGYTKGLNKYKDNSKLGG